MELGVPNKPLNRARRSECCMIWLSRFFVSCTVLGTLFLILLRLSRCSLSWLVFLPILLVFVVSLRARPRLLACVCEVIMDTAERWCVGSHFSPVSLENYRLFSVHHQGLSRMIEISNVPGRRSVLVANGYCTATAVLDSGLVYDDSVEEKCESVVGVHFWLGVSSVTCTNGICWLIRLICSSRGWRWEYKKNYTKWVHTCFFFSYFKNNVPKMLHADHMQNARRCTSMYLAFIPGGTSIPSQSSLAGLFWLDRQGMERKIRTRRSARSTAAALQLQ